MTDEQKEKARFDMQRSVDRMRDKLVEVCTIAAEALKEMRELEGSGDKWRKLSSAIGTLRSKLRPEPGTLAWSTEIVWFVEHEPRLSLTSETGGGAHFTPPEAVDAVLANPPFDSATGTGALPSAVPLDPNARHMIGIHCTPSAMIAWNFQGIHVVCDAKKLGENQWSITGRANGIDHIYAIVTGGRWTANCYLKAIRNGMTSRARRVKGLKMNAAAKAAMESQEQEKEV